MQSKGLGESICCYYGALTWSPAESSVEFTVTFCITLKYELLNSTGSAADDKPDVLSQAAVWILTGTYVPAPIHFRRSWVYLLSCIQKMYMQHFELKLLPSFCSF